MVLGQCHTFRNAYQSSQTWSLGSLTFLWFPKWTDRDIDKLWLVTREHSDSQMQHPQENKNQHWISSLSSCEKHSWEFPSVAFRKWEGKSKDMKLPSYVRGEHAWTSVMTLYNKSHLWSRIFLLQDILKACVFLGDRWERNGWGGEWFQSCSQQRLQTRCWLVWCVKREHTAIWAALEYLPS